MFGKILHSSISKNLENIIFCIGMAIIFQPDQEDNQHLSKTANRILLSWQEVCTQDHGNVWKKLSKIVLFKDPNWSMEQKYTSQASKQCTFIIVLNEHQSNEPRLQSIIHAMFLYKYSTSTIIIANSLKNLSYGCKLLTGIMA